MRMSVTYQTESEIAQYYGLGDRKNRSEFKEKYQDVPKSEFVERFVSGFESNPEARVLIMDSMKTLSSKYCDLTIDVTNVDMHNCTIAEFSAVLAAAQNSERYSGFPECDFTDFDVPYSKKDYFTLLEDWRDKQAFYGNMVGYNQAVGEISALRNFVADIGGINARYPILNDEKIKDERYLYEWDVGWNVINDWTLSDFTIDDRTVIARYDDSSTPEHPVVIVYTSNYRWSDNDAYKIERVDIVDVGTVDPQNATGLEMFALIAHENRQKLDYKQYAKLYAIIPRDEKYNDIIEFTKDISFDNWVNEKIDWPKFFLDKQGDLTKLDPEIRKSTKVLIDSIIVRLKELIIKIEERKKEEITDEMIENLFINK